MDPIYIRTDKNGTKIFHDYTCPRCGGFGQSNKWFATGKICYACGGSGKRTRPLVIKEYTPEYEAKLEARRIAKNSPKTQEEKEEEWRQANLASLKFRYAEKGCGEDGVGYVLNGNTYPIKDQIKANGGKWIYGVWVCPVEIKANGVTAVRIDLSGCINEYGCLDADDVIWEATQA